jgi:penicillin amidase
MNTMARKIAPLMANALLAHEKTKRMGQLLSGWDHRDDPDKVAPTIFHAVYQKFALNVFQDDLGEELARVMLGNWYFWKERLQKMVLEGTSSWFDDIQTKDVKETRDRLFLQAALEVTEEFRSSLGQNLEKWKWGKVHRIEFVCPIRQKGFGRKLLGGGSHPAPGSVETLCRGIYDFNQPFSVTASASLRMVADLSDEDKVLAILPGGVSGRMFDPHYKDQIRAFINGQKLYWWLSDKSIKVHSRTTLVLNPQ